MSKKVRPALSAADAIIFHASGLERSKEQYRDYYCDHPRNPDLLDLVAKGLMTGPHGRAGFLDDGLAFFRLTPEGVDRAWRIKRGELND